MLVKSEGIVLREVKFEETNKILTIFSRKYGKITAMAKGALRPRSPLIASSQVFSYSDYNFYKGKSFYHVNQGDIIDSFYPIREDMNRLLYGAYLLELVDSSTVEEVPSEKLFELLKKGLKVLSSLNKDFLKFIIGFEIKYISFLGYRPYLNKCVLCGEDINDTLKFSISHGGVICERCFKLDPGSKKMDKRMLNYLKQLLYTSLDELDNIKIPKDVMIKIQDIMVKYILTNIEKNKFNSLDFMESIKKNGGL
ncbi:DNA repair protein RecO [Anaerosalibacter bizertensis]|uniref:DNA repair protein RecO n=1 Tax=Anaerosalibacter bizertensis TaxID=932217 RepID=UPI001C0EAF29|nr:DNA repair protein RecO [Anaerosalibacter bizertensis]MBU5293999.1 DNA repair protein RecO [Anaerosalibacter bizertensis]